MSEHIYEYDGKIKNPPDIESGYTDPDGTYHMTSGIQYDVPRSDMINKDIDYCFWSQEEGILYVHWKSELSAEDKAKLDVIVQNNLQEEE